MAEITAQQVADALVERGVKALLNPTCTFVVSHGGVDGYERNLQLAQFMTRLRTSALVASRKQAWPHPTAVSRAEVSIVAHGSRCGPKTLAHLAEFFGKHMYAGRNAATLSAPVIIKTGAPRLEITIRAMEIIEAESSADRVARLGREAPPPAIRQDGTVENEMRDWETPAFITDQGIADINPLDDRLDRMESAIQIPKPEDDVDPPSVINAEDPDTVLQRWKPIMAHETEGTGSSSKGRSAEVPPKKPDKTGSYNTMLGDDGRPKTEESRARQAMALNAERINTAKTAGRPLKGQEPRMRVQARVEPSVVVDLNEWTGRNSGEVIEAFHKLVMMANSGAQAVDIGAAVISLLEDGQELRTA